MMNMYEMIETYGKGRGVEKMWESVAVISDAVEHDMDAAKKNRLMRKVYCVMSGGHYNEQFAREDVEKMHFKDDQGKEHHAPFLTDDQIFDVYEKIKENITSYNMWDWYVVMNMIYSDSYCLVKRWFPDASEEQVTKHLVELALAWLNDDDNPFGKEKAWRYFNSNL